MKISNLFLIFIFCLPTFISKAQELNSKVLLEVDGNKIQAGEFIRMYEKSFAQDNSLDVENYLKQYIIFKLKVTDAIRSGIDTTTAFKNELNGYRNQLAANYLTDDDVKGNLLKKAYQRYLTEVNAWHILVAMKQDASPADTLKAWKKATDIRERIIKGEPFESVARGTSDDKSVKTNGGNLGYFSVFQMIMPFEDAAYTLKLNSLSMPVRTPYGYHIIKVTDRRPSRGKIKVAHIMKVVPQSADDALEKKAETEITNIYEKLRKGESFSALARDFSDHKESAAKGGELEWFGAGDIISEFAEPAFALKDTGTYTKPVHTPYGWHIIKLLDKKAPGSFEETRSFLESRINQSYLNSLSRKSFVNKLKKVYKFKLNQDIYRWFVANSDSLVIRGLKKFDRSSLPQGMLYTFADQSYPASDFAGYLENKGTMVTTRDSSVFISKLFDMQVTDNLTGYENSLLESKYPDFRYLMNEFHDGMCLFEISGRKVWNRVSSDTSGLKVFYENNKTEWMSGKSFEGEIFTMKDISGSKALISAVKKYAGKPDMDDLIMKKLAKNDSAILIKHGIWFEGDDAGLDKIEWKEGIWQADFNGNPAVVYIAKVIGPAPKKLKDIRGDVMTAYQKFLEDKWIEELNKKYSVTIAEPVLGEVKEKLGK
jgi:peptidyl-prolyl cis-trans isomerase SurA